MSQPYKIGVLGTGHKPSGASTPPAQIAPSPDFTAELFEARHGFFPSTPLGRSLTVMDTIDAGLRAAAAGCDGLFINTFGDYAIEELRSAVDIPVVGAADAGLAIASQLGAKIGIVTIWPRSLDFIYRERLRATGQEGRVTCLRYVLDEPDMAKLGHAADDPVEHMRSGKSVVLERIIEQANQAIMQDSADVILLGCTCMSPAAARIADRLDVPVVDPLKAGYAMTESLVRLSLKPSRSAYPRAQAPTVDAFNALMGGDKDIAAEDDCPVCLPQGDSDETL